MTTEFCVARATDGPCPTVVVDGRSPAVASSIDDGKKVISLTESMRPKGALKTIVIAPQGGGRSLHLTFYQLLIDGTLDGEADVCVNSAACALSVARYIWNALADGPIHVIMGGQEFIFEELLP